MPSRFRGTTKGDRWTERAAELNEFAARQMEHQTKRLAELTAHVGR
jgi:hypothetical protein